MGLSTKRSTTKQNQNTTMTTTPTNPEFVTQGIEGLAGKIGDVFGGIDPSKWTADANPLQTQAAGMAASLGNFTGYGQPNGGGTKFGAMLERARLAQGGAPQAADPFIDAMNISRGVAGSGPNTYDATGYEAATGKSASLLDGLGRYMSPYTKDVVDTSLADYDFGAGKQIGQANLDLANDATFGGSGGSLYRSALGGEIARGRGALSAGLRDQAFNTGANLSLADAGLRQQMNLENMGALNTAGQFNAGALNQAGQYNAGARDTALNRRLDAAGQVAGIGAGRDANTRANVGTQFATGAGMRDIEQGQNRSEADKLMAQIAAFTGLPLDLLKGQTATGTLTGSTVGKTSGAGLGDWLNLFASNAQAAAAAAGGSDINFKRDIETVGQDPRGFRIVEWSYRWDPPEKRYRGVIAQEVRKIIPEAVREGPGGLYVNYDKLGFPMQEVA